MSSLMFHLTLYMYRKWRQQKFLNESRRKQELKIFIKGVSFQRKCGVSRGGGEGEGEGEGEGVLEDNFVWSL